MTIDRFRFWLSKIGTFLWQYIGVLPPLAVGGYAALYSKDIDISDAGHYSNETKWFIGIILAAAAVQVAQTQAKERQAKGKFGKSDFLDLYTEALSKAIAVLPECEEATLSELQQFLQITLSCIADVVASYHRKNGLNVNANVMIAVPTTAKPLADFGNNVKFTYPGLSYTHVLRVIAWGKETGQNEFCLAVHEDLDQVLFGAPRVFKTGKMEHHRNIKNIKVNSGLLQHQEKRVKEEIISYFQSAGFTSFVSMSVKCGSALPPAVLSIQSNKKDVFGVTEDQEEEMRKYVMPFNDVLSFIVREYMAASTRPEGGM